MFYRILIASAVCVAVFFAVAGQSRPVSADQQLDSVIEQKIKPLLRHPAVINAVKVQNQRNAELKQDQIIAMDNEYIAERKQGRDDMIKAVLANDLSKKLRKIKNDNDGAFTEIFIMDNRGLNVAQSDPTTDIWQGDEKKWQQTYLLGPHAVYISPVEYDESTGKQQIQVSATVSEHGLPIGAATFGIDMESLK